MGQFDVETKSLLANAEWAVTDTLTLSGGARYTWDRLEFRGCTKDVNGNALLGAHSGVLYLIERAYGKAAIPDAPAKPNECLTMYQDGTRIDDEKGEVPHFERGEVHNIQKESNFSWRAALSWRPVPELMAYASASRGYKSGVNPLNTANSEKQDAPVKQEELTAYEAGARLDIDRFRLGVGGFYYDYRDKQLSGYYKDPVFTTLAALVNVPKSKAWGIEGDLSVEPVRGITLFGNALYLKTKILETDPTAVNELGRLASYNGSGFGVPKWALSGGASFNTSLGEALGLRATVNYRWQSKTIGMRSTQFAYEEFGEKIPEQSSPKEHYYDIKAYGLLNANITLFDGDDNDWEFSIWGRNLNQTDYAIGVKSNATTIFRIPGDPRTFGATFRVNF